MNRDEVLKVAKECGAQFEPSFGLACNVGTATFERFAAAMYAAGAEDMRERAAISADSFYGDIRQYTTDVPNIGVAIRAIPTTNTEGAQ